ncbi:hypothetical protein [Oryza sativa Japonica Group]|uniref:Uncharacterized protein n=1 Tax=Oryza sativa subsp. japonica TaxID=39947 RepID=Q5N7K7_ORYSJ|nr:hypothetical protein [Oryza sativa Japonica Group]
MGELEAPSDPPPISELTGFGRPLHRGSESRGFERSTEATTAWELKALTASSQVSPLSLFSSDTHMSCLKLPATNDGVRGVGRPLSSHNTDTTAAAADSTERVTCA